jgi:hypothetical protein
MARWTTAAALAALLLSFSAQTAAQSVQPSATTTQDSLRMNVTGPGKFFLGGNQIEGPWVLSYGTGRLSVNGYRIATRPASAVTRPRTPLDTFLNHVGALMDSLNRSGTPPDRSAEILRAYCVPNSLGVGFSTHGNNVVLHTPAGGEISLHLGLIIDEVQPVTARDTRTQRLPGEMAVLAQVLEHGGIVFIHDSVTKTLLPSGYRDVFISAVGKVRSGEALDTGEAHVMSDGIRKRILQPLELEHRE